MADPSSTHSPLLLPPHFAAFLIKRKGTVQHQISTNPRYIHQHNTDTRSAVHLFIFLVLFHKLKTLASIVSFSQISNSYAYHIRRNAYFPLLTIHNLQYKLYFPILTVISSAHLLYQFRYLLPQTLNITQIYDSHLFVISKTRILSTTT